MIWHVAYQVNAVYPQHIVRCGTEEEALMQMLHLEEQGLVNITCWQVWL